MKTNAPISEEEILLNIKCKLETLNQMMEEVMPIISKIKLYDLNDEED
ncbi:hypothetical protein HDC92_001497 [Pedobacter sp. AK017]|nr:hypothetical protein [Pedobacter sp. AK017]MBB5437823.1 hypothetical protein [Pedobacter sp. AK017]